MKIQAIYTIQHRDEVREFETPEAAQAAWDSIYKKGQLRLMVSHREQ